MTLRPPGVGMSSPADDSAELRAAYVATRSLLGTRDALAAQRVVVALCHALGAQVAPADAEVPDSVPMDISLGEGPPLLPVTGDPRVRALLVRYLAPAVLDARSAVERGRTAQRLLQMATIDVLTGVWGRQSLMFAINHARPGDCVALIDIDHFKTVNDTLGQTRATPPWSTLPHTCAARSETGTSWAATAVTSSWCCSRPRPLMVPAQC